MMQHSARDDEVEVPVERSDILDRTAAPVRVGGNLPDLSEAVCRADPAALGRAAWLDESSQ